MSRNVLIQNKNSINLFDVKEEVNIILCPTLYSVRFFDIPIESNSELKLVIPNFFEDFFDIEGYSFYHIKLEKYKYMCFAYKQDEILEILDKINLELKYIKKIYFLQNEINFENNTIYNYKEIKYICSDNIIVPMPKNININSNCTEINTEEFSLSKYNIFLNKSSKYIDNTTAYILSFIFIMFSLFNFYKINANGTEVSIYEQKINSLKQKYNVPSSMIQTKSIINEYKDLENSYIEFLNAFEYILKYRESSNTLLKSIEYKNNRIILNMNNKNKVNIERHIQKKYKILNSRAFNDNLLIEIKI